VPNNLNVVQSGDLLTWRQYQDGVGVGGIRLGLTNGNGSAGVLQAEDGQLADRDTVTGSWQMRAASLSAYQGLPISSVILGNVEGGTPGNWDIYLGDITLVHPDGTILPIYSRTLSGFSFIFKGPAESNVSVITEKVAATPNELNTTFYSGDQIGSTTILTDGAGWPVSSDIYYPFGQEPTPAGGNNHYKFTGQERDSEANLDYFNARHYSFAAGRFMSPDPYNGSMDIRYPQTFNRYSYVLNNPLGYTDPSGLDPFSDIYTISVYVFGAGGEVDPLQAVFAGALLGLDVVGEAILGGLFAHPTFHGSTKPRPDNTNCQAGPMNLTQNNQIAKQLVQKFWYGNPVAAVKSASTYINLVGTGGGWDPKNWPGIPGSSLYGPYTAAGNINFGSTCAQFGSGPWVSSICQYGAGAYGHYFGAKPTKNIPYSDHHGDQPADNEQIQQGIAKAKC
jgi:RHS repeat-associated protein